MDQLHGRIPLVLDGGACAVGVESTIVAFELDRVLVYRLGGVPVEDIEKAAGGLPVIVSLNQSSNPAAPGMLKSHYAPRKPLVLIEAGELFSVAPGARAALVALREREASLLPAGVTEQRALTSDGSLAEAAKQLFATLRAMDTADVDVIYAERCAGMTPRFSFMVRCRDSQHHHLQRWGWGVP